MTEDDKAIQEDIAELKRRKLRAETLQVERDIVLNERRHFLEWLRTIAIAGATAATIIKVFGGA
ncbi:hypothetical protein [Pseudohalioglobus lutimaris]|jgi:alkylation response protein AidB-like acyl-CoA dehydrogenase|uniref:Uncharacterized protein n=1 Tax=Pseudohalioglobus lutimaris TaxID=1737061 RepID=A0A2N5WZY2_9GAMM|nr:hypothetical protein [Pseudohalioglobus lutimaris]PLW67800.1 hypothetical protein C0039_15390 [Pseudohalioglobus lutimaris]